MFIRETLTSDIEAVVATYTIAKRSVFETRDRAFISHWDVQHPSVSDIYDAIEKQRSFVCVDENDVVHGSFFHDIGSYLPYLDIDGNWINDDLPYGRIHKLVSNGNSLGIAKLCLDWCLHRMPNLRLDTPENNIIMQHILEMQKFKKCGKIALSRDLDSICFHKVLNKPIINER